MDFCEIKDEGHLTEEVKENLLEQMALEQSPKEQKEQGCSKQRSPVGLLQAQVLHTD